MNKVKKLAIFILMIITIMVLRTKVEATTGVVNSETVRLRKEPSTKSTILEQLDKDNEVEILEEADGWYKVVATIKGEKITGYISSKLLNIKGEKTTTNTGTENQEGNKEEQKETTETVAPVEQTEKTSSESEENTSTVEEQKTETIENKGVIEEGKEYTLTGSISIKMLPTMTSRDREKIDSGNIRIVEKINNWCKVENEEKTGWIRVNLLKKSINIESLKAEEVQNQPKEIENQPEEAKTSSNVEKTAEEQEKANTSENVTVNENKDTEKETKTTDAVETQKVIKTAYVSADGLRVRKEPNTKSEIIDTLSVNTKVSIIEQLDGWYKIKLAKQTGYVSSKYISDTKVTTTTSRSGSTIKNTTQQTTQEQVATEQPKVEETPVAETNQQAAEPAAENTSSGTTGNAVVEYAKQYLGYKYVSGGASPSTGFDCSGFTTYVFKHFGVSLNRSSKDQIKNGVAVEKSNLQPGDLLIFKNEANTAIGHVGIYIGGGSFIHASNPKGGVKIDSISSSYYSVRYVGARRVI